MSPNNKPKSLTNREKQLIRFLRQLKWGQVRVRVENGQPVLIYEAIKTLRLGDSSAAPQNNGSKSVS